MLFLNLLIQVTSGFGSVVGRSSSVQVLTLVVRLIG